jgi:hypothetical protein
MTLLGKLRRLEQVILRARSHYDIWRIYSDPEILPQILPTLNRYSEFSRFDEHAHKLTFVVYLYQLLDRRRRTINLQALIAEAKGAGYPPEAIQQAEESAKMMEPTWKKICIIRSNLFAHRSDGLDWEEAFVKAAITPDQICGLMEQGLRGVHALLNATGHHLNDFSDLPGAHALRFVKGQ